MNGDFQNAKSLLTKYFTLTNAQIVTMFSAPTLIVPAPPAGSLIEAFGMTLENINGGTAYTGGGSITLAYGNASPPVNTIAGSITSNFLTSPIVTQIARLNNTAITGPGIAATLCLGVGLYIVNLSANFAQAGGAGTMRGSITYKITSGW